MGADHGVRQGDFHAGGAGAFGIVDRHARILSLGKGVRPVVLRLEKPGRGAGAEVIQIGMLHPFPLAQVQKLVGSLRVVAAQIDAATGSARKEIDHLPPGIVLAVGAAEMAVFAADDAAAEGKEIEIVFRLRGKRDPVQMRKGQCKVGAGLPAVDDVELETQLVPFRDDRNRASQSGFFQKNDRLKTVRQRLDRRHFSVPGVVGPAAGMDAENPGFIRGFQDVSIDFRTEQALERQCGSKLEFRPNRLIFKDGGRVVDPAGGGGAGAHAGGGAHFGRHIGTGGGPLPGGSERRFHRPHPAVAALDGERNSRVEAQRIAAAGESDRGALFVNRGEFGIRLRGKRKGQRPGFIPVPPQFQTEELPFVRRIREQLFGVPDDAVPGRPFSGSLFTDAGELEPHHEFAAVLILFAVPVAAPAFPAVAADGAGGILHAPVDAGIDEIVSVIDFGYRNRNLLAIQQQRLVNRNLDPVIESVGSRAAGRQPRIGGVEHQLSAAAEADPEALGEAVRRFPVELRTVIEYADMQLQIDLVRLFETSGRQFIQREFLFRNTAGAVAGQNVEGIQSAPLIAVVGQLQNAGEGGFHPPLRSGQRQQCGQSQGGNRNFFQYDQHDDILSAA